MAYMGKDEIRTTSSFHRQAKKKANCIICFDDNIDSHLMFSVDNCSHRFCLECVKQHIKVKLLDGMTPKCPYIGCKSELSVARCGQLLTNKLSLMWENRIKEDLIPLVERIYCPYQGCSYLMSKTELISQSLNKSGIRICLKCNDYFCIHCKVPWHSMRSCADYKKSQSSSWSQDNDAKLKSLAQTLNWRQCSKCQHMIELTCGCSYVKCRCGYAFCYDCGAGWYSYNHRIGNCTSWYEHDMSVCILIVIGVFTLCTFCIILNALL